MHQDYPFFPHERHTMLAAIIHFDDAPLEKGCVRVVPGSHRHGPLEHEREGSFHLPPDEYPVESATPIEARAGDVLIFSYLLVHGSGVNTSDEARTTLLVQMRAPDDPPTEQTHLSRGQGMMLRGVDPNGKELPGIDG
jgi:ectoine hydroxylase-related dioxygenase (phytanoyl-CoA dioxygenase family)